MKKRIVVLESPLAGNVEENIAYAKRALADSLKRGESPMASHLLYAQEGVLDDTVAEHRELGLRAGLEFYRVADACVIYWDLGISLGMDVGIQTAYDHNVPVEYRKLEYASLPEPE